MNKKVAVLCSVFLLAVVLALCAASANSEICEVCSDVENTFVMDEIQLGSGNTITLKGYESHGLKSLSVSCELICGRLGDYCCYDAIANSWKCDHSYMYCDQQNDNGKCVQDTRPPSVSVAGTPASAVSSPGGVCSAFVSQDVTARVICSDGIETGCDTLNYFMEIDTVRKTSCPAAVESYFPVPASGYVANRPYYICAAAMDLAGNFNRTAQPVQICTSTGDPIRPWLYYDYIGGSNAGLVWSQTGLNSPNFARYELHYEKDPANSDFVITPANLKATITAESEENAYTVTGLDKETRYCFKVVTFDKTTPTARNATSAPLCLTTRQCNSGESIGCFIKDSVTFYGDDVNLPETSACAAGEAMCDSGTWGACMNQVGPFDEVCNGLDDDCDGTTDMVLEYSYSSMEYILVPLKRDCLARGECGYGYVECTGGAWESDAECSSYSLAKTEICNGLDDDCDGTLDDVGGSSVASTRCGCYGGAVPVPETCNGLDDDCNERRSATGGNTYSGIDDNIEKCACSGGAHRSGDLQEACNTIDDDCNGAIDDGSTGSDYWLDRLGPYWPYFQESSCGTGTPCTGGHWECNIQQNGVICSTIGGSENKVATETCDGADNDCDQATDEGCQCSPGNWTYCGLNTGACIQGQQECKIDGTWGQCIGYQGPETEKCNGADDDCDGIIDNVNGATSINASQCRCFNGTEDPMAEACNGIDDDCDGIIDEVGGGNSIASTRCGCYNEGTSVKVSPGQHNEICNGIDDDCDSSIDDPWQGSLGQNCGTGACAGGKMVCATTGNHTVCSTNSYYGAGNTTDKRSAETCNGRDDDCNGVVDDVDGKRSVAETLCGCYGGNASAPEACNSIDDDCDGAIDDNVLCACYDGQLKSCGSAMGECELGRAPCVNGTWGACAGGKGPAKEICNSRDDDCSGITDDVGGGYSVEETQCGCYNDRKPAVEKCDGVDNDCNGRIDDEIDCSCSEGEEMQCGSNVGQCSPGVKKCVSGRWEECKGGVLPKLETCNGRDDDCNGVVDDVNGGNSIGSAKCACYNNFAKPGGQTEISNGIDDNCEGTIDEGYSVQEPSQCSNGIKDRDEENVDCGGPCETVCPKAPPVDTWILIFAVVAGVIAVFGIFMSSFWGKGEKKSLFERME